MKSYKIAAPIGFVPVRNSEQIRLVRKGETLKNIIQSCYGQFHFTRRKLTEIANELAKLNGYEANYKIKPGDVLSLFTAIDVKLVIDNIYTPQPADRSKPKN